MAETKKTDNHYTADKIKIRLDFLPEKDEIKVLDCYGGRGVIWEAIKRKSNKRIIRHAIDKRDDIKYFHYHGDNIKVMASIDLCSYDVIDLDAYGIPADQIDLVIGSGFKGPVFVTAIQTMHGGIPKRIISDLEFPDEITKKAPSLLARRGWQHLKDWLYFKGIRKIVHRSKNRKHYFYFNTNDVVEPLVGLGIQQEDTFANLS